MPTLFSRMLLRLPKEVTYKGLGQRKYIQLFIYNVKVAFLKALTESAAFAKGGHIQRVGSA